jgi:hypothetical protein
MADDDDKGKNDNGGKPNTDKGDDQALKTALEKERTRATEAENQLKALRVEMAKLKKDDDATKTEQQKMLERIEAAEKKAAEAEARQLRAEVAVEKKLTPAQAKRLAGTTREELLTDADELLEAFKPAGKDGDGDTGNDGDAGKGGDGIDTRLSGSAERKYPSSGGRPKEKLTSGAVPGTGSGEKSPAELAESILKSDF